MASYPKRIWAFLRGNQGAAEDLGVALEVPPVPWIAEATSDDVAKYAVEVCEKSAAIANEALVSLQSKAATLLTLLMTLAPLAVAIAGVAVSSTVGPTWARLVAFALFSIVVLLLVSSGITAFLASGLLIVGGVNPSRLGDGASERALRIAEADAWYYGAALAMDKGPRIAQDLFQARRLLIIGLLVALVGSPFLAIALNGTEAFTGDRSRSATPKK